MGPTHGTSSAEIVAVCTSAIAAALLALIGIGHLLASDGNRIVGAIMTPLGLVTAWAFVRVVTGHWDWWRGIGGGDE
jgi:hypothetical protein